VAVDSDVFNKDLSMETSSYKAIKAKTPARTQGISQTQASLPLVGGGAGVAEVYAGVRVQRLRLRFDLGVGEWG